MERKIFIARKEAVLTLDTIDGLAGSFRRLPVSRREALEWGTRHLHEWIEFRGLIFTGEGKSICIYPGILDDEYGEGSDGEWISDQRRRDGPRRCPRKTLLGRLQLWLAIFAIAGRPSSNAARRKEVAEVRELLKGFTPVSRARYIHAVRELRRSYAGPNAIYYGAAIKRLRTRFAEELAAWHAANS